MLVLFATRGAGGQEPATVNVWYRSIEGCPSGAEFLARLEARRVTAKIASVGDSIDFVVTLGTGPKGSTGLLERQTSEGVVAVRTVDGDTCEQVASAVALSLALAAEGQPARPGATATAAPAASPKTPPPPEPFRPRRSPPREKPPEAPVEVPRNEPQAGASSTGSEVWIGAQATVITGLAPSALPGALLFAELRQLTPFGSSLRVSAGAASTSSAVGSDEFRLSVVGGRLEGCPAALATSASRLVLTACAALDLGAVLTSGAGPVGLDESALWSALAAHARVAFRPLNRLSLEAQVGGLVPLTRYELGAAGEAGAFYRAASVGFAAAIGVALQLP